MKKMRKIKWYCLMKRFLRKYKMNFQIKKPLIFLREKKIINKCLAVMINNYSKINKSLYFQNNRLKLKI